MKLAPAESDRAASRTVAAAAAASFAWAFLLNMTLELLQSGGDVLRLLGYNFQVAFWVFLVNTLVIWVVVLLALAVSGRLWVAASLTAVAVLVIGAIDHTKLQLRREPVFAQDIDFLTSPGFLVDMVGLRTVVLATLGLVVLTAAIFWSGRRLGRRFPPVRRSATPRAWRLLAGGRVVTVVLCALLLAQAAQFNADGNRVRALYDSAGAQWAWWNQKINYERHGVVAGLLYNLDVPARKPPAGYSRETMLALAAKYSARAEAVNRDRDPRALDDVNVVMVLSEAFSDPTTMKGAKVDGDPIPFTRDVMRSTTSGNMLAQLVGGGTANMEYEVLTGLSLAEYQPQLNSPYQMLVTRYQHFPSAVGYFKSLGHETLAIHPFLPQMYKRNTVYPRLGFDRFTSLSQMSVRRRIGDNEFVSDESSFTETIRQLRAAPRPAFVNLVTMQNHYPMANKYDDPWPVSDVSGEERSELAGYARGLSYSDQALERFLGELGDLPERTAVVFYGDHLPAFWSNRTLAANGEPATKSTPFFVWTNFDSAKQPTPELLSPIHFLPLLLDQLGAPEPPYYALLDRLRDEIPAMEQSVAYDAKGELLDPEKLSPEAREVLDDYRLMHYDLSEGRRHSQAAMFYPPAAESASAAGE